jgi:hypothetical protein
MKKSGEEVGELDDELGTGTSASACGLGTLNMNEYVASMPIDVREHMEHRLRRGRGKK